ncbi:MAG: Allergen V5/Tpx related protein [Acidobacteriales bacterium]|nr:Allergen V5/Tpx related protein [Terriglobales bacterium]
MGLGTDRRLRKTAILLVIICLVLAAHAQGDADFHPDIEGKLFDSLNQERAKAGLPALMWNEKLVQSARTHAERMAAVHMLSHRVAGEQVLTERVAATSLRFNAVAENVAYATDPDDIHPGWMHSAGHRKNILSQDYNSVGVGVLKVSKIFYAVQNFAHVTSEDTVAKAEKRLGAAFNRIRKQKNTAPVRMVSTAALHDAACRFARADKLVASEVPHSDGQHFTIAFTAAEPEELPPDLVQLAGDPNVKNLYVGSCYMTSSQYLGGTYWFAVVY